MARESLEHSFLPGASLWADIDHARLTVACAHDGTLSSAACKALLGKSEKARLQWRLEQEFEAFEKHY
jgi:adenosine deaminase